jgi:hypothetical protein
MKNIGILSSSTLFREEDSEKWVPISSFIANRASTNFSTQASQTVDRLWKNRYMMTKDKLGYIFIVSSAPYPMANKRNIVSSINSQVCAVYKTWGNYPAIKYSSGILWKSSHNLIPERDNREIGYLDGTVAKTEYKNFKAQAASRRGAMGGLLTSAISYFTAGALANADGIKGFYVCFNNEKGGAENFAAVGKADLIDAIVKSAVPS